VGKLAMRLAGDVHHYTRHVALGEGPQLVVSGGGGAFLHPTHCFHPKIVGNNGKPYKRVAAYPSVLVSRSLSFSNLTHFRKKNWLFDMVSGMLYFMLVVSCLPVCGDRLAAFFDNDGYLRIAITYEGMIPSVLHFMTRFTGLGLALVWEILSQSYLSLGVLSLVMAATYLFPGDDCSTGKRIIIGLAHGGFHLAAAITCALVIEILTEMAMRRGHLAGENSEASYRHWTVLLLKFSLFRSNS